MFVSLFVLAKWGNNSSYAGGLSSLSSCCVAATRLFDALADVSLSPGVLNAVDRVLFGRRFWTVVVVVERFVCDSVSGK